jgi:hypothetical protein
VRRSGDRRVKRRSGLATAFARVGLWLAAVALLAQSFAVAAPRMPDGGDSHSAVADLRALLGPGVVICTQADSAGSHHQSGDCRDQCPLCQLVANAALLNMPTAEPLPAPALALSGKLGFAPQPPTYAPRPSGFSLARGPPSQT